MKSNLHRLLVYTQIVEYLLYAQWLFTICMYIYISNERNFLKAQQKISSHLPTNYNTKEIEHTKLTAYITFLYTSFILT